MIDDPLVSEQRQLTSAAADLAAEFPDVPHEVILRLVQETANRYQAAKVRTFLPILVAKDVRAVLRGRSQLPAQVVRLPEQPMLELATDARAG